MRKTPRIYTSYFEYFTRRVIGPLVLIVAVFAFAFVFFWSAREAEMARIRAIKAAQAVQDQFQIITTDQD